MWRSEANSATIYREHLLVASSRLIQVFLRKHRLTQVRQRAYEFTGRGFLNPRVCVEEK